MGLTAYRVAKELGVPLPRVYDVVKGKRAVSADTALRLGAFFRVARAVLDESAE